MSYKEPSGDEQKLLFEFPAYISLLAANIDGKFDDTEQLSAVRFNEVKTYSGDPILRDFFEEVDKTFKSTIERLNKALPVGKVERDSAIKKELLNLDSGYSSVTVGFAKAANAEDEIFLSQLTSSTRLSTMQNQLLNTTNEP